MQNRFSVKFGTLSIYQFCSNDNGLKSLSKDLQGFRQERNTINTDTFLRVFEDDISNSCDDHVTQAFHAL